VNSDPSLSKTPLEEIPSQKAEEGLQPTGESSALSSPNDLPFVKLLYSRTALLARLPNEQLWSLEVRSDIPDLGRFVPNPRSYIAAKSNRDNATVLIDKIWVRSADLRSFNLSP
jgi:hypothetical protein